MARDPRPTRARRSPAKRAAIALGSALFAYGILVAKPSLVFAHELRIANVVLHAHTPLPARAADVTSDALARVRTSPFYDPTDTYDVFLTASSAEYALFALWNHRSGAISQTHLAGNVFLRPSHVERDRLLRPSGLEVPGERTLAYYIAHEITHTMVARGIGRVASANLAAWQREGYADYVGKGDDFDRARVLRAFGRNDPTIDPKASGLYLRYHLLVATLLRQPNMTPALLLARRRNAAPIERALREEAADVR